MPIKPTRPPRSLRQQLTLALVAVTATLLVVASFFHYRQSEALLRDHIEGQTRQAIEASGQYLNQYLDSLKSTAQALASHPQVVAFADKDGDSDQAQSLRDLLATVLQTHPQFVSAVLISQDGRLLSNGPVDDMVTSSDMMTQPWYQAAVAQQAMPVLTGSRMEADQWVISVSQQIQDASGQQRGVVRLDIDYHAMAAYLNQLELGQGGFAYILDQQGHIVYSPHQGDVEGQMPQAELARWAQAPDGYTADGHFLHHFAINQTDWTLVGVATLSELTQWGQRLMQAMGLTLLVLGLVVSGLVTLLLRRGLKPLGTLEATMAQVAQGQTHLRADLVGARELQQLAQHFNAMIANIERLMAEASIREQEIRTYELKALSSQINPHFLYNTLDTIIWMAEFNDSDQVVALTKALAHYFRLSLNQGQEVITLAKELDHVRTYLYIQQQRYGDQLHYSIVEDPALADLTLPKLVLQPLVENALYHGIKEKAGPGHIEVTSQALPDGRALIEVCDDGIGFDYQGGSQKQLGGVGLANVARRLELYFGAGFELAIESAPGQGTRVRLWLPVNQASREESEEKSPKVG